MPVSTRTFQTPKGTRDFYPPDHAVRRHIETAWREVSIGHGFDEIDGPTFEHLDLYTVKSGPGIVSELFSFRRAGGDTDYALRPEFTPTLARMFAARAGTLSPPTKWFSVGPYFRAERPQRGRLREHIQWNVDVIGDAHVAAELEVLGAAVSVLERLGLGPTDVRIRISDRQAVAKILGTCGVADERLAEAFELLDKRDRTAPDEFERRRDGIALDIDAFDREVAEARGLLTGSAPSTDPGRLLELAAGLAECGLSAWCEVDLGIVRGLAYYTSTVFEIHEASGQERAIAGGGRYDHLVELFGGPATPAVGIAMGDVVIRLVLEERGVLPSESDLMPRPDAFVISAGKDEAERRLRPLVAGLRRAGLHVRHSYRATRNVGKLLSEASKARARHAVILGDELEQDRAIVKDLDAGTQAEVPLAELAETLRR